MTITAKCKRAAISAAVAILLLALILHEAPTHRPAPESPLAQQTPAGPSIPAYRRGILLYGAVEDITFSPSGNRMAVVTDVSHDHSNTRLQLWDTRSWTPLPAQESSTPIAAIAFSPDGSILAAVDVAGTLTLREPLNGGVRRLIHPRKGGADSMAFSPGGDRIAIGYEDGGVDILHTPSMRVERSLGNGSKDMTGSVVCFSPDGRQLAANEALGFLIYDTATWAVRREVKTGEEVEQMAFISNSQLAVGGDAFEHNWVTVYDPDTGRPGKRFKSTAGVGSLAVSRDGKMVGIGGRSGTAQLWDAATGRLIRALDISFRKGQNRGTYALTFGPNGRILAVGGLGWIEIWSVDAVRHRIPPEPVARPFLTLRDAGAPTFAPRGHLFAAIGCHMIGLWDTRTWRRIGSFRVEACPNEGATLAFSKDGRLLACGGSGFFELCDVKRGRLESRKTTSLGSIERAPSPDGRTLAAYDGEEFITVRSTDDGRRLHTFKTSDCRDIAYSPDGRRLAMGNRQGASIWNTRNWRLARGFDTAPHDTVQQLLYSPDGRFLAAGIENVEFNPDVIIWDAHSGRRLRRLDGQTLITVNGFSRDGRSLRTTGRDKRMQTWSTDNWRLEPSARDPRPINAAAFSPDGEFIAGTADDSIDSGDDLEAFAPQPPINGGVLAGITAAPQPPIMGESSPGIMPATPGP